MDVCQLGRTSDDLVGAHVAQARHLLIVLLPLGLLFSRLPLLVLLSELQGHTRTRGSQPLSKRRQSLIGLLTNKRQCSANSSSLC